MLSSVIGIQLDIFRIDDTTVLVKAGLFQLFSDFFTLIFTTHSADLKSPVKLLTELYSSPITITHQKEH